MNGVVLVLNQNYEPLNVCNLPRAFRLVFGEKAEVIEYDHQVIRTPRTEYHAPSVIRLQYQIRRPRPRVKLTPARDLRPRPPHLPVLRPPDPRPDARPHRARAIAAAATRGRTSSRRARRATTARAARRSRRRGSGCTGRRSSRAATSTRCSRRTSPTSATRPGGRTCSWAGTEPADDRRAAADPTRPRTVPRSTPIAAIAEPSRRGPRLMARCGRPATPRTSSAGRCATRCSARPAHDWDLATAALPEQTLAVFPDAVYENAFGTVAVRRGDADVRDHDVPDRPRLRRLPAAAPGRVRGVARGRPRPPRLHDERDRLGRGRPGDVAAPGRPVRRARGRRPRGRCARSATRARGSRRTRCGCSGRSASPRRSASTIEPATLAAIARDAPLAAHLSGERIATELERILAAERPSVGLRLLADTGLLAAVSAGARRAARHAPEQDPGRGPLGPHARGRSTPPAAPPGRPARRARPRHRQARDRGRRPLLRPRDRRRRAGRGAPRPAPRAARGRPERVVHLVRHHMFRYEPPGATPRSGGSSARSGPDAIDDLFALREADNVGSGVPPDADELSRAAGAGRGRAARPGRCSTGRRSRSTATT